MTSQRIIRGALAVGLLLALTSLHPGPIPAAYASTITVNTTDDELDSDGDCSLREAIQAANKDMAVSGCAAGSGADTITLPPGTYTLTILGADEEDNASGDLDITSDLTINGGEGGITIIQAGTNTSNGIDRVLDLHPGVTVEMNTLWIEYGRAPDILGERNGGGIRSYGVLELTLNNSFIRSNHTDNYAGGIYISYSKVALNHTTVSYNTAGAGGAIFNQGTLTLTNSLVEYNSSVDWGGGIDNISMLTLNNSTVTDNTARGNGGGIYNRGTLYMDGSTVADNTADKDHDLSGDGGGIWNNGPLDAYSSSVADNHATYGGGIYNDGDSTVILSRSTVADNGCAYSGGGIYNVDSDATMILHRSTVNDNDAGMGSGGGIYHGGGDLTLNTCTISGNTSGQSGGGIYSAARSLALRSATIAHNGSDFDGDGSGDGGGIYIFSGTAQARNTIIGNNVDWDTLSPDCWGTLTSQGYNLVEDTSTCTFAPTTGDLLGFLPVLGALGDNGGPTWTHALLGGSPAINWIPDGTNGCQAGISTDQRDYPRASGAGYGSALCDIGAYEYDTRPRIVEFSAGTYGISEDLGSKNFTVIVVPDSGNTITVDYATTDGTATAGSDYTAQSDTLIFDPGINSLTFSVPILEDELDEVDETIMLTLSDPTNASIGGVNPVTLTIWDNDPLPALRFSEAAYSVHEGQGSTTVTINLNPASGRLVEVDCATSDGTATAGSDYTATSERLFFYPRVTSRTFTVPVSSDALDESNETVILTLSDATNATIGGTNPAILTIADPDEACSFIYLPLVVRGGGVQ